MAEQESLLALLALVALALLALVALALLALQADFSSIARSVRISR
jgi:hypothetical protein